MAGAAARALQYEYKAVGVNFMYEKLKAVVNTRRYSKILFTNAELKSNYLNSTIITEDTKHWFYVIIWRFLLLILWFIISEL